MTYIRTLFIVFLLSFSLNVSAEEINAGFVQGLWYSSSEILEGVPIRVYAALRNNTPHDLVGTVRFTDNGKRIGSAPVSALSGRLVETWIDWTPTYGDHAVSVALVEAELHVIGGEKIQADVASTTISDTLVADKDTDKDGVGDKKDLDDDNDTVPDTEEIARGTDPHIPNPKTVVAVTPEEVTVPIAPPETTPTETGLEEYIGEGPQSTLLSNLTEKIVDTKQSVDAYREARERTLQKKVDETPLANSDTATITRSSIEPKNTVLSAFITGIHSVLQQGYTFILFILSQALGHPALIQLLLLLGILYIFYRTVRRMARRPI
jgi:hypothetical protein